MNLFWWFFRTTIPRNRLDITGDAVDLRRHKIIMYDKARYYTYRQRECVCMCVLTLRAYTLFVFFCFFWAFWRSWTITFRAESFKLPKAFADFIRLLFQHIHKTLMHYTFGLGRCLRFLAYKILFRTPLLPRVGIYNSGISDVYVTAAR